MIEGNPEDDQPYAFLSGTPSEEWELDPSPDLADTLHLVPDQPHDPNDGVAQFEQLSLATIIEADMSARAWSMASTEVMMNNDVEPYIDIVAYADDETVNVLSRMAHDWAPKRAALSRVKVFAERSRRPEGDSAWLHAVRSAEQYDASTSSATDSLLETLAEGQSDATRLNALLAAADRHDDNLVRARVYRAVATRYAAIDDLSHAQATIHRMQGDRAVSALIDESHLAIVDYWARQDAASGLGLIGVSTDESVRSLSRHMQPWGIVKIGAALGHKQIDHLWKQATPDLARHWDGYNLTQRSDIIGDIARAGDFNLALAYAIDLPDTDPESRIVHDDVMIDIANAQIAVDDFRAGKDTLAMLKTQCTERLRELHAAPLALSETDHLSAAFEQTYTTLARISSEQAVMTARISPLSALASLEQSTYLGPNRERHQAQAQADLCMALARDGDIDAAVTLAEYIADDPHNRAIAALAFAGIGHALRMRIGG